MTFIEQVAVNCTLYKGYIRVIYIYVHTGYIRLYTIYGLYTGYILCLKKILIAKNVMRTYGLYNFNVCW